MLQGSNQWGKLTSPLGITVQSIDELLAPYVQKEYERRLEEKYQFLARATKDVTDFNYRYIEESAMEETVKELE